MLGRILGRQGGIQPFSQMQAMDGLLRRSIPPEVQDTGRTSPMRSKEIGEQGHVRHKIRAKLIIDFDLEAGYDYLLGNYEFIDGERTVALGASYGGYMVFILILYS